MQSDPTQNFYDRRAKEYEEQTTELQPVEFLNRFMRHLPVCGNILDVGCAFGRDTSIFESNGFVATGVDYSSTLIARAKQLVPNATFLQRDMRELDFEPGFFDGIWAFMSLLHLQKVEVPSMLHIFHSLLRENGRLAVGLKEGDSEGVVQDSRYADESRFFAYYSKQEVIDLLKEAAFEVEWASVGKKAKSYADKPRLEFIACKKAKGHDSISLEDFEMQKNAKSLRHRFKKSKQSGLSDLVL